MLIVAGTGCTNVEEWGISAQSEPASGAEEAVEAADAELDVIRFGDDQQIANQIIDYSTWPYDPATLYADPTYQLTQFDGATQYGVGDTISLPDRRMDVVVEKIEPFTDANESGKYGVAVIYRITNTSDTVIFLSESTAPSFALFSPEGVSLKSHYDLQGIEPTAEQEYEGRIVYPQTIYDPSMKSMEIPAGSTVTIYRMYDFAGVGTYHLFMSTDKYGDILAGSVGITFDITTSG